MTSEGHLDSRGAAVRKLWQLARFVWASRPLVAPVAWRRRMRACMRCSLYRHDTHQCGSACGAFTVRSGLLWFRWGCGCSMPLKNLLRGSVCWARETGRNEQVKGIGWPRGVD